MLFGASKISLFIVPVAHQHRQHKFSFNSESFFCGAFGQLKYDNVDILPAIQPAPLPSDANRIKLHIVKVYTIKQCKFGQFRDRTVNIWLVQVSVEGSGGKFNKFRFEMTRFDVCQHFAVLLGHQTFIIQFGIPVRQTLSDDSTFDIVLECYSISYFLETKANYEVNRL